MFEFMDAGVFMDLDSVFELFFILVSDIIEFRVDVR